MRRAIVCSLIVFLGGAPCGLGAVIAPAQTQPAGGSNLTGAKGLEQAMERLHAPMRDTPALAPREELKRFKTRPGMTVDLIASEPQVRQPLCINFDERGRMWVVQYIQYPFPAGLKVVEYDQYLRAKFDKVPLPPPHQVRGNDRITILEDVDGDGSFRKAKTFLEGLNIATSALPGRGGRFAGDYGAWVLNPPYLLFYPDKDRNDVPDGDPIVHLSGFGLEDTHAVANNLTWGPDGWLYGCQGSTCTAHVKVEGSKEPKTTDFLGQAIWRYHPETHRFEMFAEGGGNTFGLEFDDAGRAYSGTNWGNYRGLYYVQGGYYLKSWGKHGPLTNPFAFGYFEHMPHTGNADRLSHTFVIYGGGLLGSEYDGKIISPNPLRSRVQVTRLEPLGSSFRTIEEPFLATCDDGWFRPVDLKAGPDGASYVADMYEKRISHVDPRDTWDRTTGRIFRLRPTEWKPGLKPFDFGGEPVAKLVQRLSSRNRWERATARRVLGERGDASAIPVLRYMLAHDTGRAALEGLWALNLLGGFNDSSALIALSNDEPTVRMWAVRLLGDTKDKPVSAVVLDKLLSLAAREPDPQVRSQLASTAKRLPAEQSVRLVVSMLHREQDASDVHIPLLLWWALEDKAVSQRDRVVATFTSTDVWQHKLARDVVLPRLARRYAAQPTPENQQALVQLLEAAPGKDERAILLAGITHGFEGLALSNLKPALKASLMASGDPELAIRLGDATARQEALRVVADDSADAARRSRLIELLGQIADSAAEPVLVGIAQRSGSNPVRRAAISALGRFADPALGRQLVGIYPQLPPAGDLRQAVIAALLGRPVWTTDLLRGIQSGAVQRSDLGIAQIEQIRQCDDPTARSLADQLFGKMVKPTSQQKQQEIARVTHVVTTGTGNTAAGKELFAQRCAVCHTLFSQGAKVGPDLTGYERRNVDFLVLSIVDPSAYIREEYTAFRIRTRDGETRIGLITERGANQITIEDAAQQKTAISKDQIVEERALPTSLMPEGLLDGLSDQQVRDLFKYLGSEKP